MLPSFHCLVGLAISHPARGHELLYKQMAAALCGKRAFALSMVRRGT